MENITNPIGAVYKELSKAQKKSKYYKNELKRMPKSSVRRQRFEKESTAAGGAVIGIFIVWLLLVLLSVGGWILLLILVIKRWTGMPDWLKVVGVIGLVFPGWGLLALILVLIFSKKQ